MQHFTGFFAVLLMLAACSSGGNEITREYKHPSVSNSASAMSTQTLCYRYAYAKADSAVKEEVRARHLDCAAELGIDNSTDNTGL